MISSEKEQRRRPVFSSAPVTRRDFIFTAMFAIFIALGLNNLLSFGSDYISDYYHIKKIEYYLEKGVLARINPQLSDQQKAALVQTAQSQAYEHNAKIKRRVKSSESAIGHLNAKGLRGYEE